MQNNSIKIAPLEIIGKLIQNNKKVIVCGLSLLTKKLISKSFFRIDFVLDNNISLQNTKFFDKKILNFDFLTKNQNLNIVILCNLHTLHFLNQVLYFNKQNDIYIQYKPELYSILTTKKQFIIETADYVLSSKKEAVERYIPQKILRYLIPMNFPIQIIPTKHHDDWYFKPRNPKKNQFLFSYHSVGNAKFNIIRLKEGYFSENVYFDKRGYSGFSSKIDKKDVKKTPLIKAKKDFKFYADKYIKNNLSKYIQPEQTHIKLPKNYVFFAMQVANDSVARLGYFSQIELLKKFIKIFDKNKISLVIKRHPKCNNNEIQSMLNSLKNHQNIHVIDTSIHTLIKHSKAVYTVNSGVGFEALLHLKPVVLFGKSDYESACFTCKDLDKLNITPKLTAKKKDYIKKFISYYMNERNFLIDDEEKIKQVADRALAKFFEYHLQKRFKCKVEICT